MIVYQLRCSNGHEFEAWFRDSGTYDQQAKDGDGADGSGKGTSGGGGDGSGKAIGGSLRHVAAMLPADTTPHSFWRVLGEGCGLRGPSR